MRKSRKRGNSFGPLWLFTAVLVLLFIVGLFYLKNHSAPNTGSATTKPETVTKLQKPKFDFYTVLPQNQESNSSPSVSTPQAPVLPKVKATESNKQYILQVAAVKSYAEADKLKAELTLLGFNVTIQKVTLNNVSWNRVTLGPYASSKAAQVDQANLQKNKIKSILLPIK